MICPFCQAELDPGTLSCPRCGAAHPGSRGGVILGLRLRTVGIAFVLLVITSLILVDCVMHQLPHGAFTPNSRTTAAQRALLQMQHRQQATENGGPPPPRR